MPYLQSLALALLATSATAHHYNHGCLLARARPGDVREDLRQCFTTQLLGDTTWAPKWCAGHTFFRDGNYWHRPAACTANCASCLQAGFDSGADAAGSWRR